MSYWGSFVVVVVVNIVFVVVFVVAVVVGNVVVVALGLIGLILKQCNGVTFF